MKFLLFVPIALCLMAQLALGQDASEKAAQKSSALDLSGFSRADFELALATVGTNKLKPLAKDVIRSLPLGHKPREGGIPEAFLASYMQTARRLFETGEAVPVADVSLDSSLDAGVRQPMLNYVSMFSNSSVNVFLLVQKPLSQHEWKYYSIVEDKSVSPSVAYYGDVLPDRIDFKGAECFACHASGPRVIRPFREDLISDVVQANVINEYIMGHDSPMMNFPSGELRVEYGAPLTLKRCAKCHSESGERSPLYRVHAPSIRALVDHGYMPPKGTLSTEEAVELLKWITKN